MNLDAPITVLVNRPDLRAAEHRLQSSLQSVKVQKRSWYPSITLGVSLSASSEKAKGVLNIPLSGGFAAINLLFLNWQTMKWKDKTAQANLDSAKLNFEKALTTALNKANINYLVCQNAQAVLNDQEQRYVPNKKNSRCYQVCYQHGKNELKDWLEVSNTGYGSVQNVLNQRYETLKHENMVYKAVVGRYTPK